MPVSADVSSIKRREREEDCTMSGIQKMRTTGSPAIPSSACERQESAGDVGSMHTAGGK